MITIVIGLALADFITGIIRAYIQRDICSRKMRAGGLNKVAEIIIMATACGLEIGISMLGESFQAAALGGISGAVAAGSVFAYITLMELVSILENYGEISPDAVWVRGLVRRLRSFERKDEKNGEICSETHKTGCR